MNELIECFGCGRLGLLRLDTYPPIVEHDRGARRCELPPRDLNRPRLDARYVPNMRITARAS